MRDYCAATFPSLCVTNSSGTYISGLGKGTLQQHLLQLLGNSYALESL